MSQRIDYKTLVPAALEGFNSVHTYVAKCGFRRALIDLVYLRVSLINGCAYCIDLHTRDLQKEGVPIEKIVLVPVWHEAGELFTAREKAALSWAETVTRVEATQVPDAAYEAARKEFNDKELVDLTVAISLMNAYNRMAVSFRAVPAATQALQAAK